MKKSTRGAIAGIGFLMGLCFAAFGAEMAANSMLEKAYADNRKNIEKRHSTGRFLRIGPDVSQEEANAYFEAYLQHMMSVDEKVAKLKNYEKKQKELHRHWEHLQEKYPDKYFNFIIK